MNDCTKYDRALANLEIHRRALELCKFAEQHGLNVEIVRAPSTPLATGNHEAVVTTWLRREFTRPE